MIRAELTKIRTLRSTFWVFLATFALCVGLGFLIGLSFRNIADAGADSLFASFYAVTLGQIALVVFGVFVISSEYSSGTIHASLAATPRRGRFFLAKLAATTPVVLVLSLVTIVSMFFAARAGLGPRAVPFDARGVAGATVYLTLICLFATGVATMLRSAAGSLAILLPLLFLGSQGLGNIPKVKTITQYLPDQTAWVIMHLTGPPGSAQFERPYGPWTGLALTALWTLAALLGGYAVLRKRDV
ncbi:ABC transporter permease subunit [Allorhizocola rhizosphaerae]|uniref:ABC transporter permease subunit n=1 Tax=Allorhizocola rhizosphaerae TaxID=1872709 RepID=UPI000E3D98CC|nr:ABC transporter permease subunit [Allorhizocola rhizosphaerae]